MPSATCSKAPKGINSYVKFPVNFLQTIEIGARLEEPEILQLVIIWIMTAVCSTSIGKTLMA